MIEKHHPKKYMTIWNYGHDIVTPETTVVFVGKNQTGVVYTNPKTQKQETFILYQATHASLPIYYHKEQDILFVGQDNPKELNNGKQGTESSSSEGMDDHADRQAGHTNDSPEEGGSDRSVSETSGASEEGKEGAVGADGVQGREQRGVPTDSHDPVDGHNAGDGSTAEDTHASGVGPHTATGA